MRLRNFENRAFLTLVLLTSFAFIWMVRGFLLPVFWAAVLAVLFHPVYSRLLEFCRGRAPIAAALATLTAVLVVLVPLTALGVAVTRQAIALYHAIAAGDVDLYSPIAFIERSLPRLAEFLAQYDIDIQTVRASIESAAVSASQYVASQALSAGQNTLLVVVMFGLMLYFLFFFFRDGQKLIDLAVRVLPFGDDRERRLFDKFADVSRATVKGTIVVAAVQGAIGGLMFAAVGIRASVFWGVVMGILSLLPAVGASLVWIPAAIYFAAVSSWGKVIFLVLGGALVVGLIDNILRPILVGREAKMPDYLVLLATLGGLAAFGLSGFVLGPMIAALFLVVWDMLAEEYSSLDSSAPPVADQPLTFTMPETSSTSSTAEPQADRPAREPHTPAEESSPDRA